MATVDRQIDDASAMTRGKKEYSTVHFIEAALLMFLLSAQLRLLREGSRRAQGYSVSQKQRGVSTKTERESLQCVEKIKYVCIFDSHELFPSQ